MTMRSTFFGLSTLLRGLVAQQNALDTVNHNIANANTEGYSRQRVEMAPTQPFSPVSTLRPHIPGQVGTGVEVVAIRRIRDRFIDDQYRKQSQTEEFWKTIASGLQQVESLLAEPGDHGIGVLVNRLFKAWQEVADNPSSQSARVLLREQAQDLASGLNHIDHNLRELRHDVDLQIALRVPELNDIAQQIASLNAEIMLVLNVGDTPNDLQDQRDLLLDQLNKLGDFESRLMPDGSVGVFWNGRSLVVGDRADTIIANPFPDRSPVSDAIQISGNTALAVAQGGPSNVTVSGLPVDPRAGTYKFNYTGGAASTTGVLTVSLVPSGGAEESLGSFTVTAGETRTDLIPGVTVTIGTTLNPGIDTANAIGGREGIEQPIANITRLQWTRPHGDRFIEPTDGELGALVRLRDTLIPGTIQDLDKLASALVTTVNRYHKTGIGLDGSSNRNFFNPDRTTAGTIIVDAGVLADHRAIAAAGAAAFGTVTATDHTTVNVTLAGLPEDGRTGTYFFQYSPPATGQTQGTLAAFFEPVGAAREKVGELSVTHSTTSPTIISTLVPGASITLRANPENGTDQAAVTAGLSTATGTSVGAGNNRMALTIATLAASREAPLGNATFEDYYAGFLAQMGVDVRQAERQSDNQGILTQHLDRRRESISGVSIDEEATRLIQFQRAYQAAARGITVMDQILDTIINGMGVVGR
ncbi:MAG: flagellar hook-associated protein FlgK [Dehalococcoidia bacterium]|nr:flagellar hook-associated protein FlgK [Dehalococcoidia bacterium]